MKALKLVIIFSLLGFFSCNQHGKTDLSTNVEVHNEVADHQEATKDSTELFSFNSELLEDLKQPDANAVAAKWTASYRRLPEKFKNQVVIDEKIFPVRNTEGLLRGFNWSCSSNSELNQLGEEISINIGYNDTVVAYRSGMVFQYVKNQLLKCP